MNLWFCYRVRIICCFSNRQHTNFGLCNSRLFIENEDRNISLFNIARPDTFLKYNAYILHLTKTIIPISFFKSTWIDISRKYTSFSLSFMVIELCRICCVSVQMMKSNLRKRLNVVASNELFSSIGPNIKIYRSKETTCFRRWCALMMIAKFC